MCTLTKWNTSIVFCKEKTIFLSARTVLDFFNAELSRVGIGKCLFKPKKKPSQNEGFLIWSFSWSVTSV